MLKCNELVISIRNLRVPTLIGAYQHERKQKRELVLNIELKIHEKSVLVSDELCDTIDYETVANRLYNWIESQDCTLLEHLAHLTILRVFEFDARIASVHLEIFKPGCISCADGALIKMSYSRNESSNHESTRNN